MPIEQHLFIGHLLSAIGLSYELGSSSAEHNIFFLHKCKMKTGEVRYLLGRRFAYPRVFAHTSDSQHLKVA